MDGGQITGMVIVLTICATIVALRVLRLKYRHRDSTEGPDIETMQEMNRGLQRMDQRIEALETLLMDSRKNKSAKSEFE
jgi:phage shock protein B